MNPLKKVYICSSLRAENYDRTTKLLEDVLPKAIHLRPYKEQRGNRLNHVEVDIGMIKHADEVWVVSQYGKDCSWEIGYACGKTIPVVIWRDESNAAALESDWMLYHGVNAGLVTIRDVADLRFEILKATEMF